MQHVIPGIGMAFHPVEDELQDTFLQAFFQGEMFQTPEKEISGLPVKQDWMISLTLLRPPGPTEWYPVLSQETSSHRSAGRLCLG